jgi:hypothetical protein
MGDRAYIQINSEQFAEPIIFYGHWAGEQNLEAVKNVLMRTSRIGDAPYLAAQLFHEFSARLGSYNGDTGFGIMSGELASDRWENAPAVIVNADTGVYEYQNVVCHDYVTR